MNDERHDYLLFKLLLSNQIRRALIWLINIVNHNPWFEPQDCIWPEDEEDYNLCSIFSGGWHHCDVRYIPNNLNS